MNNRYLTARQSKEIDLKAQGKFLIPDILLMENAGRALSEEILRVIAGRNNKIAIFCGKGNNGGDGFCAARHLLVRGICPDIYICGDFNDIKGAAKKNLEILLRLKQKVFFINESNIEDIKNKIIRYSLIVDALLGVGLERKVSGILKQLIKLINNSGAYVISVDIPSGLDATTGKALGACIYADRTVTFVARKKAMAFDTARNLCGDIVVKDIGVPL